MYKRGLCCALLALSYFPVALAGQFSISTGVDYSTGDYGAELDTDVWAIPFSIKYKDGKWSYKLSTSFLRVKSPTFVTPDGDFFNPDNFVLKRIRHEGMGDINLATTYNMLDDRDYLLGMDVTGRIKIPYADEDEFLGTGEMDFGLNVEFYKTFGDWSPYWNIGYRWRGDPEGFNLKNTWSSSIGTDYRINQDLSVGLSYDWQQKTVVFVDNAQESSAYVNYYLNDNNKINFYVLTGYSDSSPNWGSGLILIHYF